MKLVRSSSAASELLRAARARVENSPAAGGALGYRPPPARRPVPLVRPVLRPEARQKPPLRFGPRARRTIRALAAAVAPPVSPEPGWDPGAVSLAYLSRFGPYLPRPVPALLGPLFAALEWVPLLLGPRRRPLSRLSVEQRRRCLERLLAGRGPLRRLAHAVRGLVALSLYDQPAMWRAMRYDAPDWIRRKVAERRARLGTPEPW